MFISLVLLATACSNASSDDAAGDSSATSVVAAKAPTTTSGPQTSVPRSTAPSTPATPSTTAPPETAAPTTVPSATCTRAIDFETEAQQQPWRVTLDGVMGGLSSGDVGFENATLVFTGEIVTDGGGFSLVRAGLGFDAFTSGSHLIMRARTDGRAYKMVFKDAVDGQRSRLFHEATMPFEVSDREWQEIRIELSDLPATINGRWVDTDPFDKDAATELGIILSDGVDGEFRLEVDWIDVCADPQ